MKLDSALGLDRILECAVVVSWADLIRDAKQGLIHVEYDFAPDGSLEYLRVLQSVTRGHWDVACEYWMSASMSHGNGLHFEDGFRSEGLARTLGFIFQHQHAFSLSPNCGRPSLLQIQMPTEEESAAAATSLTQAFCRVSAFSAEPSVA